MADPPTAVFATEADGMLAANPSGDAVVPYPASYGVGTCAAHDAATEPYCADADGASLPDAPDWCLSAWCWVDPAACDVASDPSSYFHIDDVDATLYYSYDTCGDVNTFADSEEDAQACNEEHSEVVASHCGGAVQADARCPCVDWSDDLQSRAQFESADGSALVVPLDAVGDDGVTEDYSYALGYGSAACAAHDATHAPYCADAAGAPLDPAPDWCASNWCWVDPQNCILADAAGNAVPAVASSYFHMDGQAASRYYSYETCQHENTFSDTDLDPQACNDEHSEVVADHCLTVGAPDALDSCPCISTPVPHPYALDGEDAGSVGVSIGGAIVAYPTGYGMSACAPHDSVLGPSCADETGAPFADAAAWCSSNWCFVDPANCEGVDGDVTASSYFHRDGEDPVLFYSYGTCSGDNTFTDSTDDDQACNSEHSDVTAGHCDGVCNIQGDVQGD